MKLTMIEFDNNTIVYMTAALESACRQLKNDSLQSRAFIADRLEECAAAGKVSKYQLNNAAQDAVILLNRGGAGKRPLQMQAGEHFRIFSLLHRCLAAAQRFLRPGNKARSRAQ